MTSPGSRERDFHIERACAELEAAFRAKQADIAAIHLKLCTLHVERVHRATARS